MEESRLIVFRGVPRILPTEFIDLSGRKIEYTRVSDSISFGNRKASTELMEGLVPFDMDYVTEYERLIRHNYVQVVECFQHEVQPSMALFQKLPDGYYTATADWLGDGRLVKFNPIEWVKNNIFPGITELPYDKQIKMLKYCSGPRCPSAIPENLEISYKNGIDRLGTIFVNPEVAMQWKVKHRYPPYGMTHLLEGSKIRGPFIKGTVVYNRDVPGICFTNGSWKSVSPENAIRYGFWIETLPHYLCKSKVTVSYTMYEHITNKLRDSKTARKMVSLKYSREELFRRFIFENKGKPQVLRIVEAIRLGVPINYGSARTYINEKITDVLDKHIFNPVLPGIRAVGIELESSAKEIIIPKIFAPFYQRGEKVVLFRDPVSWKGAIQIAKIKGYSDSPVIKIPHRLVKPMQGDFDGDQYNIIKKDLFDRVFNINIYEILRTTPAPTEYEVQKDIIPAGSDPNELYKIALVVELGKQSTGMMVHIRDNVVSREQDRYSTKAEFDKAVEFVYHKGPQQVLQSKNAILGDIDYRQYPFELAKKIGADIGIPVRRLISKNGSLAILRKRVIFGTYKPEENTQFAEQLNEYTQLPMREFSPVATVELILQHYHIPENHLASARKIVYDITTNPSISETDIETRISKIKSEASKRRLHPLAPIVALLQISARKPKGFPYELLLVNRIVEESGKVEENTGVTLG